MGDRTPSERRSLAPPVLRRQRNRRMRPVSPDHNHADGLHAPRVRNIMGALNDADEENNNNNNRSRDVVPDNPPDGTPCEPGKRCDEGVQPNIKF